MLRFLQNLKSSLASEVVLHVMTFDLDLYFQGHSAFDLENRVRSVASAVLDGFFSYLVQMITSMRRCVACHDLWPWPISSRSFDLVLTLGIQHDSIVWVIMRWRGVSSERRRSSCSSFSLLKTFVYLLLYHDKRRLLLPHELNLEIFRFFGNHHRYLTFSIHTIE